MDSIFDLSYQQGDLDGKIIVALNKLSQVMRHLLWEAANRFRLSPLQIQLLIDIYSREPEEARVSQLAKRFQLTKATISDALKKLEQRGLLARVPLAEDRRAARFMLTAQGQEVIGQLTQWPDPLRAVLGAFSLEEKSASLTFLLDFIWALEKAGLISRSRMCLNCRFFVPAEGDANRPFCQFLQRPLSSSDLRIDCPEHQLQEEEA